MKKKKSRNDSTGEETESLQSSAQVLRDPIDILMEEHDRALQYVTQLRAAAELIRNKGFSFEAYMQIADSIRFIDTETRHHNEKEEEYLFPLLARHVADPPRMMRYEHRELWSAFDQLTKIVNDVADGNIHGSSILELIDASNSVAELLTNHIEKENTVLFPMTKQLLSQEEYDQLKKAMNSSTNTHPKKSKSRKGRK